MKGAISRVAVVWARLAFSFLYLAFRALLGALVRRRRGLDVKDLELLVLRHELEVLRRQVARPKLRGAETAAVGPAPRPVQIGLYRTSDVAFAMTSRTRVGLGILLLALANPLDVAETYASMDVVSGGRFTLGVGLGYRDVEYDAFGIQRRERVRRFEENLRLVEALWAGEAVSAELAWCRLNDATLTILPVQRPRPPLWMAADSDRAVERAARMADSWIINPHATTSTIARQLQLFDQVRRELARPPLPELPAIKEVVCAHTRERALEIAKPYLTAKYEAYRAWGQDAALPADETFDLPFERLLQDRFVIGTPDDCLDQLVSWRDDLGVDHFIFRSFWSEMPVETALESMDLLSHEVVPVLRQR